MYNTSSSKTRIWHSYWSTFCFFHCVALHLVRVKYANDVSFCWLLSGCPILQILVVKAIGLKSKCKFQIVVQTLKKLYIWINCEAYVLEINAPALKYLHFSGMLCSGILLENSFNLVEADINIYGQLPWDFIRQLYNVKSLHLSNGNMWVRHFFLGLYLNCYTLFLWQAIILLWLLCCLQCLCGSSIYDSMKFHNLALMKLSVSSCTKHDILRLLDCAPNLEELVLALPCLPLFSDGQRNVRWPLNVPKCMSCFILRSCWCFPSTLELVKLLLYIDDAKTRQWATRSLRALDRTCETETKKTL